MMRTTIPSLAKDALFHLLPEERDYERRRAGDPNWHVYLHRLYISDRSREERDRKLLRAARSRERR